MRTSAKLFSEDGQPTERLVRLLKDLHIPGETLPEINAALQERFVQKKPDGSTAERWELGKVLLSCPEHTVRDQLGGLGFINATFPTQRRYDRAGWPGALVTRAVGRLFDLIEAWKSGVRWGETVIFGGKRELHKEKETRSACIEALQNPLYSMARPLSGLLSAWDERQPVTELGLMEWIWACSVLPDDLEALSTVFVDAPMKPPAKPGGPLVRPNTEDTILAWERQYSPAPGTMLVSSGAPYGMAQNEAFWMLLGPKGHTIETFGHAVPKELGLEVILRELAGTVYRIYRAHGGK